MDPAISVIMPVYNQEKFLTKTIESVFSQTYGDFEFLILDDGSTDNSAQLIREYAARDARIKSYFHSNIGRSNAVNKLASKAKGKLLAFIDADDLMLPQRLEKQADFHFQNPEVDATSCHCYYVDEEGNYLGKQRYKSLKEVRDSTRALEENKLIHCAITGFMIRRNSYFASGGLDQTYWPCDDYEYFNRLINKAHSLVIIQEFLMKYRIHNSSISAKKQWYMIYMYDYIGYCITGRRKGNPVVEFDEFVSLKKRDHFWKKLEHKRLNYGRILHQRAGFSFHSKAYANFIWQLLGAMLLRPDFVIITLRHRLHSGLLRKGGFQA